MGVIKPLNTRAPEIVLLQRRTSACAKCFSKSDFAQILTGDPWWILTRRLMARLHAELCKRVFFWNCCRCAVGVWFSQFDGMHYKRWPTLTLAPVNISQRPLGQIMASILMSVRARSCLLLCVLCIAILRWMRCFLKSQISRKSKLTQVRVDCGSAGLFAELGPSQNLHAAQERVLLTCWAPNCETTLIETCSLC